MDKYLKHFKIPFIIAAIVCVAGGIFYLACRPTDDVDPIRRNSQWDNSNVVFDYADKLTDEEEADLSAKIRSYEEEYRVDIALITLNQDLTSFVRDHRSYYDGEIPVSRQVQLYADVFALDNHLGYNHDTMMQLQKYNEYGLVRGDTIVFVDNWNRDADGHIYSWISTSGRCQESLTQSECESIMDNCLVFESDDDDPYFAYSDLMLECMHKIDYEARPMWGWSVSLIVGLVAAVIYIVANWKSKLGSVDVNEDTYAENHGSGAMKVKEDLFINKTVTKRKIESSSGSGGGGGGHSTGGSSFGGGGHSR